MYRLIIDTNVIVSSLLFNYSVPRQAVNSQPAKILRMLTSIRLGNLRLESLHTLVFRCVFILQMGFSYCFFLLFQETHTEPRRVTSLSLFMLLNLRWAICYSPSILMRIAAVFTFQPILISRPRFISFFLITFLTNNPEINRI